MSETTKRLNLTFDSTREPITLAVLLVLTAALLAVVGGLSRMYEAQQQALAEEWVQRGMHDMQAGKYADAVTAFRTALLYRRDNDAYMLNFAESLLENGQLDEANAYLTGIWERHPENGQVNLELARIAARQGENKRAIRYFHNAMYAAWPAGQENERRNARFELIDLLLRENDKMQAQAELIALAENVPNEPATAVRIGNLFLQAQDNAHALSEFEMALKSETENAAALAGAGRAAFELGHYAQAMPYLERAVAVTPKDADSATRLRLARLVLEMDPFRQEKRARDREQAVVNAFAMAGKRLSACSVTETSEEKQMLAQRWAGMKSQVTISHLRANPDIMNGAMSLVFRIERETEDMCGAGSDADAALLLIARNHEGL